MGFYLPAVLASLAVAALASVLLPGGIAYDPWSWLIWGRALVHGHFTTAGSATSFKPLPLLVTGAFGWTTSAAPALWLAFARAGAAFAALLAFRVAWRLTVAAGRLGAAAAGTLAGVGLLASSQYLGYLAMIGMSEPIGAAFTLAAVDAHLSRRRRTAIAMLVVASMVRIEMWAFVLAYGGWWLLRRRSRSLVSWGALAALAVAIPAAWFLPDLITTGDLLRSAVDASRQSQGGSLLAAVPALRLIENAAALLPWPLTVAVGVELVTGCVVLARRRHLRVTTGLAMAALSLVAIEAVMVQLDLDTGAPPVPPPGRGRRLGGRWLCARGGRTTPRHPPRPTRPSRPA